MEKYLDMKYNMERGICMIDKILLIILLLISALMYSVGNTENAIYFALLAIVAKIADTTNELKKNRKDR
jgi:hypothetical protein